MIDQRIVIVPVENSAKGNRILSREIQDHDLSFLRLCTYPANIYIGFFEIKILFDHEDALYVCSLP